MSQSTLTVEQVRELAKRRRSARRTEERAEVERRRNSYRLTTVPVKVRLPYPPPLNHYYRTAVVGRHAQTYISTEGKAYRLAVIDAWRKVGVTFEGKLAIKVVVVFPDRRSGDLDGLWKALLDSLEHAGAYENDKQIRAESMEEGHTEAPGWVDVVLGPKPGRRQRTLFETAW